MPDLDSGHIFLTTLAPIKAAEKNGGTEPSPEQKVRMALAEIPTAMQSPARQKSGTNSPFALNLRNHLVRMFVLNDVVYNGRVGRDAISASLLGDNPSVPKPVDHLNAAYLVFCADIDAVQKDGDPLPHTLTEENQKEVRASYARELWNTMGETLKDIYSNCVGFEDVKSADDFARYLDRCHVETTMPFHDYYLSLPKFNHLPWKPMAAAVAVPALIALFSLVLRIVGVITVLSVSTFWLFVLALIVALIVASLAVRFANENGRQPLPPGEYDDLPSVLKALYIQQRFSDFFIDNQGSDAEALKAAFVKFTNDHSPSDIDAPTQKPGVVSS